MKIQDNPIKILKTINKLMHKTELLKFPFVSIAEAFKRVVNVKQKYNKSLIYYSKRLKQSKEFF